MRDREELIEAAKTAINKVFGDMSVSKSQSVEDLKDIRDEIDILIDSLEA